MISREGVSVADDIIDNRRDTLVDHIRRILLGTRVARFGVGHSLVSGLEVVVRRGGPGSET
jgi:hypothetical protein